MSRSPWTPEQTDALTRMWRNGVSAAVIADRLGVGITRNAVIGKVHRLGLSGRTRTTVTRVMRFQPRQKPAQRDTPPLVPSTVPSVTAAPEPPVARQEPSEPVTIMELRFPISQCRYIAGKPGADALYCGTRTRPGSPYCPEHHRRCNIPYVPRRRMEAAE